MKKIGVRVGYSQNSTWGVEYSYTPTDEFARRFSEKGGWAAAKRELKRLVVNELATLALVQPEDHNHTIVWDVMVA
jgi:hypothetical protein